MGPRGKNYVVKPIYFDVKPQFSHFGHNKNELSQLRSFGQGQGILLIFVMREPSRFKM